MSSAWLGNLGLAIGLLAGSASHAQKVGNYCCTAATACGIVNNPTFVNVYWGMPISNYHPGLSDGPGLTADRIDAYLGAVLKSEYFQGLWQYGVGGQSMAPSIFVDSATCPGIALPLVVGGPGTPTEAHTLAPALADCLLSQHPELIPETTVFNLILGPGVQPGPGWCPGTGGDHAPINNTSMTFIPTVSACVPDFKTFAEALTHEMVEAVSARTIWGWWDWWVGAYNGQEIGDLCSGRKNNPPGQTRSTAFLTPATGGKTGGLVSNYWSNSANICLASFTSPIPTFSQSAVSGSGGAMSFKIVGKFGGKPWDLQPNSHSGAGGMSTLFLTAKIKSPRHNWSAGDFINIPVEDTVGFSKVNYSVVNGSDVISVKGFDGFYQPYDGSGPPSKAFSIGPGDTITFTVYNPANGQSIDVPFTAPNATNAKLAVVPPPLAINHWVLFEGGSSVQATLIDTTGGAIEGAPVTIQTSGGSASGVTATNGQVARPLVTTAAGKQTVNLMGPNGLTAQYGISVHPVADSLSATIGDAAGAQTVTLNGAGYVDGKTTVKVSCLGSSTLASNVHVQAGGKAVQFTTPHSPCPGGHGGVARIVGLVDDVPSVPLAYQYVVPFEPLLTLIPGCKIGNQIVNSLEVDAYQPDGQPAAEPIKLSATYAAFTGSANSIQTTSGQTVALIATGPVKAAPVNKPQLAVTQTFVQPPASAGCFPGQGVKATVVQVPGGGPGPVESVDLVPSLPAAQNLAVWAAGATNQQVVLTSPNAVALARTILVRAIGATDLERIVSAHPYLLSTSGATPRALGPALGVRLAENGPPLVVAFQLPLRGTAEIMWLGTDAGSQWQAIASASSAESPHYIRAAAQQAGTYALMARDPLRR